MKRITITIDENTCTLLAELAKACTAEDAARKGMTTHGALSPSKLLAMLAEDAAMVISRPGSWEGSNMAQVFSSHGYQV